MFNVKVNRTNGGIGRQAAGTDYYAGYIHYLKTSSTLPTAFTTNQIQLLRSLNDLVALGITGNSADETRSTGVRTYTAAGTVGDTESFVFTNPINGVVTALGSYVVQASPTVTTTAAQAAAAINANTYLTNFSAISALGVLTITPPAGFGLALNTLTPIVSNLNTSSTIVATNAAFTGGVGSELDQIYYHVSEHFRMMGVITGKAQGMLWIGIYKSGASTYSTFSEVLTLEAFAPMIKTTLVVATTTPFATSHITALNANVIALQALNTPTRIIYNPDISSIANIGTIANVLTLNSAGVQVVLGQDAANVGNRLFKANGKSIACGGTTLGSIAAIKVMQSQGWRGGVNVVDTLEYTLLGFSNGQTFASLGSNLFSTQTGVDAYGWVFLMNESTDQSSALFGGVFYSSDQMCVASTNDYAYMPNGRTIDKASVGVRGAILPALGGNVYFNANGTLTNDSILYLQSLGDSIIGGKSATVIGSMVANGETSNGKTIIDPSQNVQGTSNVNVTMQIVQAGVLRMITINIGFRATI